jgi:hypothetical protein
VTNQILNLPFGDVIPAELDVDTQAVIEKLTTGKPVDAETYNAFASGLIEFGTKSFRSSASSTSASLLSANSVTHEGCPRFMRRGHVRRQARQKTGDCLSIHSAVGIHSLIDSKICTLPQKWAKLKPITETRSSVLTQL